MRIIKDIISNFWVTDPVSGAQTMLYCALKENIEHLSRWYFSDSQWCKSNPRPEMMESPKKLWDTSEKLCGMAWIHRHTHCCEKIIGIFSFGILMCPSGGVLCRQSHIYKQESWNSRWKSPWNTTEIISSLKHRLYMILLSDKLMWGIRGQRVYMTKPHFKHYRHE